MGQAVVTSTTFAAALAATNPVVYKQDSGVSSAPTSKASSKKKKFPEVLMDILSDRANSDIISWSPSGRSSL